MYTQISKHNILFLSEKNITLLGRILEFAHRFSFSYKYHECFFVAVINPFIYMAYFPHFRAR
ncbi:hypothetical protein AWC35_15120 [Gibbsiella quercinecans]|uniref:Uncharacterized protein n=1 Tax=Gibbsiella quercinecans TaxID=929813 RepID=A0A250B3B5_9GAMM|nr:hypothetical protein AWC35_15120 [Gibbsiella quercinecans]RLM05494.1 hypothetical protein BIY30_18270 [Gibbsiella quercinecans]RLM10720.1 hypothetical protein BIY31_06420 [Gibbsiella quercinecans]